MHLKRLSTLRFHSHSSQNDKTGWGLIHRGSTNEFFCDDGTTLYLDCGRGCTKLTWDKTAKNYTHTHTHKCRF